MMDAKKRIDALSARVSRLDAQLDTLEDPRMLARRNELSRQLADLLSAHFPEHWAFIEHESQYGYSSQYYARPYAGRYWDRSKDLPWIP